MLRYRLAAFFSVYLLFLIADAGVCQNIDSIYRIKQGPERTVTIGYFAWEYTLSRQPAKLSFLKKYVAENGSKQEQLYLEETLSDISLSSGAPFEKIKSSNNYFLNKFIASNDPFLIAYGYFTSAQRLDERKFNTDALENYMYCYEALTRDPEKKFYKQGWWLHQIASAYYLFHDYKRAIIIAKQAALYGGRFTPNNEWFKLVSQNLVAMSFLNNGDYDSARVWLTKTLQEAKKQRSATWIGIAGGNIGNTYYFQKNYSGAIPYFLEALDTCTRVGSWDNAGSFASCAADCFMQTGKLTAAMPYLALAYEAAQKDGSNTNWHKYYSTAANYYKLAGKATLAFSLDDSAKKYQEKLTAEYDIAKKVRIEAEWGFRKKQLENELALQKLKKEKLLLYSCIVTFFLLTIIGVLYYKRQRVRLLLRQEQLENEKLRAEEELVVALTEIKDFTYHILEKNRLIEIYTAEIEKLEKQNDSITKEQLHSLESLRNSTVLTDAEWASFKNLFEKVHPGYLQRLKSNYPDLTPAETRYLVFTRLNISSREMAAMLGVSAEAVRNIRFRIKKKLNVEDNNELERMANAI